MMFKQTALLQVLALALTSLTFTQADEYCGWNDGKGAFLWNGQGVWPICCEITNGCEDAHCTPICQDGNGNASQDCTTGDFGPPFMPFDNGVAMITDMMSMGIGWQFQCADINGNTAWPGRCLECPVNMWSDDSHSCAVDVAEKECRHPEAPAPTASPPGGGGDPHFKTWAANGDVFDYHGECDMVLVDSPEFQDGLGLQVHIRTRGRYQYSYIESVAVSIGTDGEDVLEVSSFGEYFLNGVEGAALASAFLGPYPVVYEQVNKKSHRFTIQLPGDNENIVIKTFKDWVSVSFEHATEADYGSSVGLLGSFQDGAKISRDGVTVMTDDNAFGQEWQVTAEETVLFQTLREPQAPNQKCILPDPTASTQRRLGEAAITRQQAEMACSSWAASERTLCVYDVLAANDLEMAQAGAF